MAKKKSRFKVNRKVKEVVSTRKPAKAHKQNPRNKIVLTPEDTAFKKSFLRKRQHAILTMYANGTPIPAIAEELGLPANAVTRNLNSAIDHMVQHYASSTPQQTFVRYAAFQMDIVRKLKKTYERYINDPDVKQYNAAIQALRGMSDIYDKILDKGHSFGVIERKKADRKSIDGKADDIRGELVAEIVQLQKLVETIDDATQGHSQLGNRSAIHSNITYTRIIKKPLRNEFGIVKAIPDWKYRHTIYRKRSDGIYAESQKTHLAPHEQGMLPDYDPDKALHTALLEEQNKTLIETTDGDAFVMTKTPSKKEDAERNAAPMNDAPIADTSPEHTTPSPSPASPSWLVKPSRVKK